MALSRDGVGVGGRIGGRILGFVLFEVLIWRESI